ncbi:MAG: AtpZ/AtpI family protein [Eubacteriales bacterium]|nr:AtpZ/AtpI family protein [Eubacteriales bacterium]
MNFKKDVYRNIAMITQLGISMLAPVILCVFIGYQLDRHFGWNTVLVLLILGILAGCRNCWMLLQRLVPKDGKDKEEKERKHEPEK